MACHCFFSAQDAEAQAGPCDAGKCAGIPGTIYNEELDQCSWADEIPGCGIQGN